MARKIDYSTEGYRVQFTGTGETEGNWSVFSYAGSHTRLVPGGRDLTEDAAHEMAARLANTTPHPRES